MKSEIKTWQTNEDKSMGRNDSLKAKTQASSFQRNRSLRTVKCATKTTKDTRWKHCDCRVLMDRWTLETTHSALMSAPQTTATKGDGISWLLTNDRREIYAGRRARDPVLAMSETCYHIDNVVDRGTFQWKTFMKQTLGWVFSTRNVKLMLATQQRVCDVRNKSAKLDVVDLFVCRRMGSWLIFPFSYLAAWTETTRQLLQRPSLFSFECYASFWTSADTRENNASLTNDNQQVSDGHSFCDLRRFKHCDYQRPDDRMNPRPR